MGEVPKRQPARDKKLVWPGGFSGYSAKEATGPKQMTASPSPGASPTHVKRRARKSISPGCHIGARTPLQNDLAYS